MEEKMLAATLPPGLVNQAKQLRAHAAVRLAEYRASATAPDAALDDLEFRILSAATVGAAMPRGASPAGVWVAIENRIRGNPSQVDPRQILAADPILLMGALCQYCDECKFAWSADA